MILLYIERRRHLVFRRQLRIWLVPPLRYVDCSRGVGSLLQVVESRVVFEGFEVEGCTLDGFCRVLSDESFGSGEVQGAGLVGPSKAALLEGGGHLGLYVKNYGRKTEYFLICFQATKIWMSSHSTELNFFWKPRLLKYKHR